MLFEACGVVSAVIPVTNVVFLIPSHFLFVVFLCTLLVSHRYRNSVVFESFFFTLNKNHIFVQFVFTSFCILCLCAYPSVILFAGRLADFRFISVSVSALEQIV